MLRAMVSRARRQRSCSPNRSVEPPLWRGLQDADSGERDASCPSDAAGDLRVRKRKNSERRSCERREGPQHVVRLPNLADRQLDWTYRLLRRAFADLGSLSKIKRQQNQDSATRATLQGSAASAARPNTSVANANKGYLRCMQTKRRRTIRPQRSTN